MKKEFFKKTLFYRTIFIILPFGLLLTFFGISDQLKRPRISDLKVISGIVKETKVSREYNKNYNVYANYTRLYLENNPNGLLFNKTTHYKLFKEHFSKGDSIIIWQNITNTPHVIAQFSKNGKLIMGYKKIDIVNISFIFFGLISIIISLIYLSKKYKNRES